MKGIRKTDPSEPGCWEGNHLFKPPVLNPEWIAWLNEGIPEVYETLTIRCVPDNYTPPNVPIFTDELLKASYKRLVDILEANRQSPRLVYRKDGLHIYLDVASEFDITKATFLTRSWPTAKFSSLSAKHEIFIPFRDAPLSYWQRTLRFFSELGQRMKLLLGAK